jgi:hypothetical protein
MGANRQQVFHVASRATGQPLFSQPLAEWFRHDLIGRTMWAAAIEAPRLRGKRVKPQLEPIGSGDHHVAGWLVSLFSANEVCFTRRWPVAVLHGTALAVGRQYQAWLGDSRVAYWVEESQIPPESQERECRIEFDEDDEDGGLEVPNIATSLELAAWRLVAPAIAYPTEILLRLHGRIYAELLADIDESRCAQVELAWVGKARIGYLAAERILVYEVDSLTRLVTPNATATLCPVAPEELLDVLNTEQPVVFIHTHVVPEGWQASPNETKLLACSEDDLRCFRRLPVGSLGVIAASRNPFCIRAYGWPADANELVELNTVMVVPEKM